MNVMMNAMQGMNPHMQGMIMGNMGMGGNMGMMGGGKGGKGGDWQCPNQACSNHTSMVFASKSACPKCGCEKPQGGGGGGQGMMMGNMGMMGGNMGMMGGGKGGDWQCPNTDCFNHANMVFASKSTCPKCGSEKPQGGQGMMMMPGGNIGMMGGGKGGDWQCPNQACSNHTSMVFASKSACPKCGSEKPQGGGGGGQAINMVHMGGMMMGGKGGGKGGKGGDWQCPNQDCKNHTTMVFASKDSCPKCGTPKPVGELFL